VLAGVCAHGGTVVICDDKRLPVGLLLPLVGHSTQTERFAAQAAVGEPVRKQAWKQIVQCKIRAQAAVLRDANGSDEGLSLLADLVKSGDTANHEAQAARRYWPALYGADFRRVPGQRDPVNSMLNYGYAILRGLTARALAASGLHPCIGVHHHNRYDAFCLADDLMEPFRPTVDRAAAAILDAAAAEPGINRETKRILLSALMESRYRIDEESRSLFDTLGRVSASLAAVFEGKRKRLMLPEF
jgi:CRISPR-associated protein Cas1